MGNASVKDVQLGSDADMTSGIVSPIPSSLSMANSTPPLPSDSPMAFTPPDSSPSIITPQNPQIPLFNGDEIGRHWTQQLNNSDEQSSEPAVAALIEWKHGGTSVTVKGSWDNWHGRSELQKTSKDFTLIKFLPVGVYQYRFFVDGQWRHSPDLPFMYDNKGNGINILEVQDYVPENLDGMAEFESPSSPESSYDSVFPSAEDFSKDPPLLPPQLHFNAQLESMHPDAYSGVQKNTIRPQHVILNHLFVETRRPIPVVALGFTQRFRTKYVTVVLHKPLPRH